MKVLLLFLVLTLQQLSAQPTDFIFKEAKMSIKMPNPEWKLAVQREGNYIFKRNVITDGEGRDIIPAIMIFFEDATKYEQDVTNFSIAKRLQFQGKGMTVDKILTHEDKTYPLAYKNSYLTLCSYTDNGLDHILYMIHIIDKDNKGIQIYMDMTKSIADKHSEEFWTAIRSIKETK